MFVSCAASASDHRVWLFIGERLHFAVFTAHSHTIYKHCIVVLLRGNSGYRYCSFLLSSKKWMSSGYDWILVIETLGQIEVCLEKECPVLQKCMIQDLYAQPCHAWYKCCTVCSWLTFFFCFESTCKLAASFCVRLMNQIIWWCTAESHCSSFWHFTGLSWWKFLFWNVYSENSIHHIKMDHGQKMIKAQKPTVAEKTTVS